MRARCLAKRRSLAGLALLLVAGAAGAQQQLTFASAGASEAASLPDDGERVVFQSNADLLEDGSNADASTEIFIIDSDGSDVSQLTDSTLNSIQPDISDDGSRVAFASSADLTGDNPDLGVEIFRVDADGDDLQQVTDSAAFSGIQAPSLSAEGTRIAFTATGDLLGDDSNADASREVFVISADGDGLAQLTDGPPGTVSQFPDIAPNGARVAFSSNADLADDNADLSNEIFVVDRDGDNLEQLTDAQAGDSLRPSVSGSGRLAFESSADLSDDNADGNFEIFTIDSDATGLGQLTDTTGNFSRFASISADGATVAFHSAAELSDASDSPVSNREIFLVDADGGNLRQLTDAASGESFAPKVSGDGARVAFHSSADLTGNNAEGNFEIFIEDSDNANDAEDNGFGLDEGCSFGSSSNDDGADPTLTLLLAIAAVGVGRKRRRGG